MTEYVKATHKAIKTFVSENGNANFQTLLAETSKKVGWTLDAGQFKTEAEGLRGQWVALEDEKALPAEAPASNTLYKTNTLLILYQGGKEVRRTPFQETAGLVAILNQFYNYASNAELVVEAKAETKPEPKSEAKVEANVEQKIAVPATPLVVPSVTVTEATPEPQEPPIPPDPFTLQRLKLPGLLRELTEKIKTQRESKPAAKNSVEGFLHFCRANLYPKLNHEAVDAILAQHIVAGHLVELIFGKTANIKNLPLALEAEKALKPFADRDKFLADWDEFFSLLSTQLDTKDYLEEKITLVRELLEPFHPHPSRPIRHWMIDMALDVLHSELGLTLASTEINILDPSAGGGEYVSYWLKRAPEADRTRLYQKQLFANEMSVLGYYLTALHAEHTYHSLTEQTTPFKGICFADSLELKKKSQMLLPLFVEENESRLFSEQDAPINVMVGNVLGYPTEPNKRQRFKGIDERIEKTYGAQKPLTETVYRFIRWATDRLEGRKGIVAFMTDSAWLKGEDFIELRQHLTQDFDLIYHLAFADMAVTLLAKTGKKLRIRYHKIETPMAEITAIGDIEWQIMVQDKRFDWNLQPPIRTYSDFLRIATDEPKKAKAEKTIFQSYSRGVSTRRDTVVYGFQSDAVSAKVQKFIADYNTEIDRTPDMPPNKYILWSANLKAALQRKEKIEFDAEHIRAAIYRPFMAQSLYFDPVLNEDRSDLLHIFPNAKAEAENLAICISPSGRLAYAVLMVNHIPDVNLFSIGHQVFAFYTYADGKREENISDWALERFQQYYYDESITKWDVFYYIYGILHHPVYKEHYAEDYKQSLPRIPFAEDFYDIAEVGRKLAKLHVEYMSVAPYEITEKITAGTTVDYAVEKMRFNKEKTTLRVNKTLTLEDIPLATYEYQIGGRSPLDWVVEHYTPSHDTRTGIKTDPNNPAHPQAIVELISKVVTVGVETAMLLRHMPRLF